MLVKDPPQKPPPSPPKDGGTVRGAYKGGSLSRLSWLFLRFSPFTGELEGVLVFLLKSVDGFLVLDFLDGFGLCLLAGDEAEGGVVAEVAEVLAGCPADVDGLDVGCGEGVGGCCALGGQFVVEGAEFAQVDLVAEQELFAQAIDGLGEHGGDVGAVVGAAVVGDVLGEAVEVEVLVDLCSAVGFGLGDVCLLRTGLRTHDNDAVVNHKSPLPTSLSIGRSFVFRGEDSGCKSDF